MVPAKSLALHQERRVRISSGQDQPAVAVSIPDAAALLGISKTTFRDHLLDRTNGISSFVVGRCRLVWVGEIARYAEAETVRQREYRVVSRTTTPHEAPIPLALRRALGQTTRRPRLHSIAGTKGSTTDG